MSLLDFTDLNDLTLDGRTLFDVGDIGGIPNVEFDVGDIGGIPSVDYTDWTQPLPDIPGLNLPPGVVQNTFDLALQQAGIGAGADPLAGFLFNTDTGTIVTASGASIQPALIKQMLETGLGPNGAVTIKPDGTPDAPASWWQQIGQATGLQRSDISKLLLGLGVGAIGFAIARGVTGGGSQVTLPPPLPPPASTAIARAALERGLREPVGTAGTGTGTGAGSLATGAPIEVIVPSTGERLFINPVTGAVMAPPEAPVMPTGTGEQQLQALFGAGLLGQRGLAEMLARTAYREGQAQDEMAPGERAIRMNALREIPGLLQPPANAVGALRTGQYVSGGLPSVLAGDLPRAQDPIRALLETEINRATSGANPALDRQFSLEDQALENAMGQALGPEWKLSTPGYDAWIRLKESQSIRRDQDRRNTIAAYAPLEESRRRLEFQAPLSAFSTLAPAEQTRAEFAENLRRTGLNERTALTAFGRRPVGELSTGLNTLVPIQPLLGLGDAAAEQRLQEQLRNQFALENFRSQQSENENLARAIGSIFGGATGLALGGRTGG